MATASSSKASNRPSIRVSWLITRQRAMREVQSTKVEWSAETADWQKIQSKQKVCCIRRRTDCVEYCQYSTLPAAYMVANPSYAVVIGVVSTGGSPSPTSSQAETCEIAAIAGCPSSQSRFCLSAGQRIAGGLRHAPSVRVAHPECLIALDLCP